MHDCIYFVPTSEQNDRYVSWGIKSISQAQSRAGRIFHRRNFKDMSGLGKVIPPSSSSSAALVPHLYQHEWVWDSKLCITFGASGGYISSHFPPSETIGDHGDDELVIFVLQRVASFAESLCSAGFPPQFCIPTSWVFAQVPITGMHWLQAPRCHPCAYPFLWEGTEEGKGKWASCRFG